MGRINPILAAHMEDMDGVEQQDVSEEEAAAYADGIENEQVDVASTEAESNLDSVDEAVEKLEEIQSAQEENIKIMEGTEGDSAESASSEGEAAVEGESAPEGEVNEAVMSEPLPADEDQAVEVIDEQIQNEEVVMESIASSLGFKATFGNSAMSQLYKALGVRTSKKTRGVGMESRNAPAGSKKQKAIQAYKAHCEGIGDTIKKLGGAVLDGIKKLIQSIIDFVKTMISGFGSIEKNSKNLFAKAREIEKDIASYDLSDEIKKGLTEVSPATLLLDLKTPTTAMVNASIVNRMIKSIGKLTDQNALEALDLQGSGGHKLEFNSAKFKDIGGISVICPTGIITKSTSGLMTTVEAEGLSVKFNKVDDAIYPVMSLSESVRKSGAEYMKESKAVLGKLEEISKSLGSLSEETAKDVSKALKHLLKAAKASVSAPKYAISAMVLAMKHVKKKGNKDSGEAENKQQ